MEKSLEKLKEEVFEVYKEYNTFKALKEMYEKDDTVKGYIETLKKLDESEKRFNEIKEELREKEMRSCNHLYLCTNSSYENAPTYHCLKCGLSNKHTDKDRLIFSQTLKRGILLNIEFFDLNFVKEMYLELKEEYPEASDWIIANLLEKTLTEEINRRQDRKHVV